MDRMKWTTAVALLAGSLLAAPVVAQTARTAVVSRPSVLLDQPRGDAVVLDRVPLGTVVRVDDRFEGWYLVTAPSTKQADAWVRGWIPVMAIDLPGVQKTVKNGAGRFMVRGFGRFGGTLFTARDSFDAILGKTMNSVYGGGGQFVLPNGVFFQASMDRFRHGGTLALGSGNQVFRLDTPTRVTLTPVQLSVGYRVASSNKLATYVGAGAGWYTLKEEPSLALTAVQISKRSVGYHVLGGVEVNVVRWVWLAGDVQWATVPKALGETGVSAMYGEKDLGGTTFGFKVIVGY